MDTVTYSTSVKMWFKPRNWRTLAGSRRTGSNSEPGAVLFKTK